MSTEMFSFPSHVIIAQGNKLFHAWRDAVHADMLFAGFGPRSHKPQEPSYNFTDATPWHKF